MTKGEIGPAIEAPGSQLSGRTGNRVKVKNPGVARDAADEGWFVVTHDRA